MQKDKSVYGAYLSALEDARKYSSLPRPVQPSQRADKANRRFGLRRRNKKYTAKDLLPKKLRGMKYLIPKE